MEVIGSVLVTAVMLMGLYHVIRLAVRAGVREALADRDQDRADPR